MPPGRPLDWLITVTAGATVTLLSLVALRWPQLPISQLYIRLFASRGLSPRTNLRLLFALGLALTALGIAGPWLD